MPTAVTDPPPGRIRPGTPASTGLGPGGTDPFPREGRGVEMRIAIDRERCVGSGNCLYWAPGTFDLDDDGHLGGGGPRRVTSERIRVAAEGCPTRAITLEPGPRRRSTGTGGQPADRCPMKRSPMPIALSDEHQAQRRSARRWLDTHCPPAVPRALLDAEEEELQPVWKEMAAQGWLGHPPPRGVRRPGVRAVRAGGDPRGDRVVAAARAAPPHRGHLGPGRRGRGAGRAGRGCCPAWSTGARPPPCPSGDRIWTSVGDGRRRAHGRLGDPPAGARRGDRVGGADPGPGRRRSGDLVPGRRRPVRTRVQVLPLASLDATRRVGVVEVDAVTVRRRPPGRRRSPPTGSARSRWP